MSSYYRGGYDNLAMEVSTFDNDSAMVITTTHNYALMISYGIDDVVHIKCGTNVLSGFAMCFQTL